RIRENSQRLTKQSFMQMANSSINQVFARSINTSLTSLIPVVVLLFFGGETLKDFAFALVIGLASGAYSSIAVASPIYAMWKEREPKFQALKKKYERAS
ncbi:MAG: protein translocase subunit SecDF, partial [Actinomycetota bacterium]|nr:protein translocase subunit SecDF [Actinomycetota bacterium]